MQKSSPIKNTGIDTSIWKISMLIRSGRDGFRTDIVHGSCRLYTQLFWSIPSLDYGYSSACWALLLRYIFQVCQEFFDNFRHLQRSANQDFCCGETFETSGSSRCIFSGLPASSVEVVWRPGTTGRDWFSLLHILYKVQPYLLTSPCQKHERILQLLYFMDRIACFW